MGITDQRDCIAKLRRSPVPLTRLDDHHVARSTGSPVPTAISPVSSAPAVLDCLCGSVDATAKASTLPCNGLLIYRWQGRSASSAAAGSAPPSQQDSVHTSLCLCGALQRLVGGQLAPVPLCVAAMRSVSPRLVDLLLHWPLVETVPIDSGCRADPPRLRHPHLAAYLGHGSIALQRLRTLPLASVLARPLMPL